jgi:hypothetical protein
MHAQLSRCRLRGMTWLRHHIVVRRLHGSAARGEKRGTRTFEPPRGTCNHDGTWGDMRRTRTQKASDHRIPQTGFTRRGATEARPLRPRRRREEQWLQRRAAAAEPSPDPLDHHHRFIHAVARRRRAGRGCGSRRAWVVAGQSIWARVSLQAVRRATDGYGPSLARTKNLLDNSASAPSPACCAP